MSHSLSEHSERWGDCPYCAHHCRATVCGHSAVEIIDEKDDESNSEYWDYRLLCCCGCNLTYLEKETRTAYDIKRGTVGQTFYSEWPEEYLTHERPRAIPEWWHRINDDRLSQVIYEIYRANNTRLHTLTAIGMRTAIDRSTELLGINPDLQFNAKLAELLAAGKIGKEEHEILNILVEAGNAAAHRGWKPNIDNIEVLFLTLEAYFSRTVVLHSAAKSFSPSIPRRIRRRN